MGQVNNSITNNTPDVPRAEFDLMNLKNIFLPLQQSTLTKQMLQEFTKTHSFFRNFKELKFSHHLLIGSLLLEGYLVDNDYFKELSLWLLKLTSVKSKSAELTSMLKKLEDANEVFLDVLLELSKSIKELKEQQQFDKAKDEIFKVLIAFEKFKILLETFIEASIISKTESNKESPVIWQRGSIKNNIRKLKKSKISNGFFKDLAVFCEIFGGEIIVYEIKLVDGFSFQEKMISSEMDEIEIKFKSKLIIIETPNELFQGILYENSSFIPTTLTGIIPKKESKIQLINQPKTNKIKIIQVTEGETPKKEDLEETKCIICTVNDRDVILYKCGHVCCCQDCAEKFLKGVCPVCRSSIEEIHKVFFS